MRARSDVTTAIKAVISLVAITAAFILTRAIDKNLGGYVAVFGFVIWVVWMVGTAYGGFNEDDYKK